MNLCNDSDNNMKALTMNEFNVIRLILARKMFTNLLYVNRYLSLK